VAAEFLSTELLVGDPAEFLTIGILHDIGKLIQMQYLHEIFVAVREKAEREKLLFIEAERGLLPLDHAGLVGQLFERWRMPETLRESIRWHHDWNAAPLVYRRSVALLAAADRLVVNLAIGNSLNFAGYREDPALIEASGVEVRLLEAANTVIRSRMDRMRGFIDCLGS
jgi:HD-like signal output (HDOD) protein